MPFASRVSGSQNGETVGLTVHLLPLNMETVTALSPADVISWKDGLVTILIKNGNGKSGITVDWHAAEMMKPKKRLQGGTDIRVVVQDGDHVIAFANSGRFGVVDGVTVEFTDASIEWFEKWIAPLNSVLFGAKKSRK